MQEHLLMAMAAAPTITIVGNLGHDQLDAPTPCSEYDVRGLVNHLLFWGPSLEGAARKISVAPPAAGDQDLDLTRGDWKGRLEAQTDSVVTAWSEPDAWEGTTQMGGPMELPAAMIGRMVLGELVVHGWDLARATGQESTWDAEVLTMVYQEVDKSAEQGREMGIYGEPVAVPDTESVLHRILGLTGRDPNWTA